MICFSECRGKSSPAGGLCCLGGVILLFLLSYPAQAHDPPKEYFNRNVTVLTDAHGVRVRYRVEVSQFSLFRLPARDPGVDTADVMNRASLERACLDRFSVLIPDRLLGFINSKPLAWTVERQSIEQLGSTHFRLDLFAPWMLHPGANQFELEDTNFENVPGPYRLKLETAADLEANDISVPPEWEREDVNPNRSPRILADLRLTGNDVEPEPAVPLPELEPNTPSIWQQLRDDDLAGLLSTKFGFGLLMLLALIHGAGHSLMPGHGKTMVAAYLVGERGTPAHAILLGVVTTLTHTSAAIGVALILRYGMGGVSPESINRLLMFLGGLTMVVVGVWLFLQRLAGGADHVHLVDIGHSHSPGEPAGGERLGKAGFLRLLLLGIAGGIIPCWGAIMWVIGCIATGQFWLALPVVLAFSVGLASVLILIGLSVVYAGRIGSRRWGEHAWFKSLFNERTRRVMPVIGAALVIVIGLFLCASSGVAAR